MINTRILKTELTTLEKIFADLKEKMLETLLSSEAVKMVYENLKKQKQPMNVDVFVKALQFYKENDAFISL
jgi:hypothetical protein